MKKIHDIAARSTIPLSRYPRNSKYPHGSIVGLDIDTLCKIPANLRPSRYNTFRLIPTPQKERERGIWAAQLPDLSHENPIEGLLRYRYLGAGTDVRLVHEPLEWYTLIRILDIPKLAYPVRATG